MLAYDLDDTLANTDYSHVMGQSSLIGMISKASVHYQPSGEYVIVTARGEAPAVHAATKKWVDENLTGCKAIYYTTGSGETGMKNKLAVINRHNLEGYVDLSRSNLAIMKKLDPSLKLYTISNGKLAAY